MKETFYMIIIIIITIIIIIIITIIVIIIIIIIFNTYTLYMPFPADCAWKLKYPFP